jgi:hypothetical protein
MIGWAAKATVQSARRTLDSDGWRYPQDCRIHKRRQTAGLAQRVDVLHSPHLATDSFVALLQMPRGGVAWAAGIGQPIRNPVWSGSPGHRDAAVMDNTFLFRPWWHGSKGETKE